MIDIKLSDIKEKMAPADGITVVTGATGHIGNVLVRKLVEQDRRLRVVIPPFEDPAPMDGLPVEHITGDVRDLDSLVQAFCGARVVYHLAGIISISPGQEKLMRAVNVRGTRNVVEAALLTKIRRLVYTSSVHALVEQPHGIAVCEPAELEPDKLIGAYAQSKARATKEVLEGVRRGLDAVIVFPSGVIGPYDYKLSEMGQLIVDFARGKLPAYVDGAYDFVDVRDVVDGLIRASEKGRKGEGYILSGSIITIDQLCVMLEQLTGVKKPRIKLPGWLAALVANLAPVYYRLSRRKPRFTPYSIHVLRSNCFMSSEKARRELGYNVRPIRQTIEDALAWFRNYKNGLLEPAFA